MFLKRHDVTLKSKQTSTGLTIHLRLDHLDTRYYFCQVSEGGVGTRVDLRGGAGENGSGGAEEEKEEDIFSEKEEEVTYLMTLAVMQSVGAAVACCSAEPGGLTWFLLRLWLNSSW